MSDVGFTAEADLTALNAARDALLTAARDIVQRVAPIGSMGEGSTQAATMELAIRSLLDSGHATQQGYEGLAFLLGASAASLRGKPKALVAAFGSGLSDIRSRQSVNIAHGTA